MADLGIGHIVLCTIFCVVVGHPVLELTGIEGAVEGFYTELFGTAADPTVLASAPEPHFQEP